MADYDVVLLPTFAQVEDWRKNRASECAEGLFAQTVTTFNAWVSDLWELHGDGRTIVDTLERRMVMKAALQTFVDGGGELAISPGLVKLAAQCAKRAAGVPQFEAALDAARSGQPCGDLSVQESSLLCALGVYRELLPSLGRIELGQAVSFLAERESSVFAGPVRVLWADAAPMDWRQEYFFGSCATIEVERGVFGPDEGGPGYLGGARMRFGFPSGRYAQPALVADMVREMHRLRGCATTVITCKDPLSFYKQVEGALAQAGVVPCVQAQVAFSSTDFGRAFLQACSAVHEDPWSRDDLSDALAPPFSGFSLSEVYGIDAGMRADRLLQREECLRRLSMMSDRFSQLEELASDPEADVLLGVFEQIAFTSSGRSDAWRTEQLSAAAAVRSCTTVARRLGLDMSACVEVLSDVVVTVSIEGESPSGGHAGRAIVTTQAAASRMGESSCDQLIVCDLTSADYPVSDRDDALATLFGKIGLAPYDSALSRARRTFAALQTLATERVVYVRPLNDWDGNPTYPAATLQELVDAQREEAASDDDLDKLLLLPEKLIGLSSQRGEELLYQNAVAGAECDGQQGQATVVQRTMGYVAGSSRPAVALPRLGKDGFVEAAFSPSPSQVELYLECPYKWFVSRRLKVEMLDEQFGALEKGTFCHAALKEFYLRFQERGFGKVAPSNLGIAKEMMRAVADELDDAQYLLAPGSGRLVAANQIEHREVEECKARLVSYLDFESGLLPGFKPTHFEFEIGPDDAMTYAGRAFVGTVDRIDVDDAGNAVIVDYKGSLNSLYEIAGACDERPGKVQARMYAQVVKRMLGYKVVGALYVSYGKRRACSGAYDGRSLESPHLPSMNHARCMCLERSQDAVDGVSDYANKSFDDMLDATEHVVERAIERMEAAQVEPAPMLSDVCEYCCVMNCPKRAL